MPVTNKTPIIFNVLKEGDRNTLIYTRYSNTLQILQMLEQWNGVSAWIMFLIFSD